MWIAVKTPNTRIYPGEVREIAKYDKHFVFRWTEKEVGEDWNILKINKRKHIRFCRQVLRNEKKHSPYQVNVARNFLAMIGEMAGQ